MVYIIRAMSSFCSQDAYTPALARGVALRSLALLLTLALLP